MVKELWCLTGTSFSVRFEYEPRDASATVTISTPQMPGAALTLIPEIEISLA